jgi:hypothetical protein
MPAAAEAGQQADFLSDSTAREAFAGVLQSDFFSTIMVALTAEPQLPAAVFTAAEVHSASEEAADVRTALTAELQLLPAVLAADELQSASEEAADVRTALTAELQLLPAVLAADELQSPSAEAADVSAALIAEPQLLAVAVAHTVFFPSVPDLSFPVKFSEKADIPAKAITVNMTNIFFIITRFLFILIWIKYMVSNPEKMLTEC